MGYSKFLDVSSGNWARSYINFLAGRNIAHGDGNNRFNPNDLVSIGELCALAVRAADITSVLNDETKYDHWARKYVTYVGSINGVRLSPPLPQDVLGLPVSLLPAEIINRPIQRQYAFDVAWKIVASKRLRRSNTYSDGLYQRYFDNNGIRDYNEASSGTRESIYELGRRGIVTGVTVQGSDVIRLAPRESLNRAMMSKVIALCVADAEVIRLYDEAKTIKIYLSPADHGTYINKCVWPGSLCSMSVPPCNRGACNFCCENKHTNTYMDLLEGYLRVCGFAIKRRPRRDIGEAELRLRIAEANAWPADLYYVCHTNMSSDGSVRGDRPQVRLRGLPQRAWDSKSREWSQILLNWRSKIYPGPNAIHDGNWFEINDTRMPCIYEELLFHDNVEDAKFFHERMDDLAEYTARGLCEIFGYHFRLL
jgi:hypothetical protein